jgi:nicotinamidase-related amidase
MRALSKTMLPQGGFMTTDQFPDFYEPQRIGSLFYPDLAAIAGQAAASNLSPASEDEETVLLLIVDGQIDFTHEQGTLHVPGAHGDLQRLIEFIYREAGRITHITCSLDSHLPYQIFHPMWWADEQGEHPAPFTIITQDDVQAGKWIPLFEQEKSRQYVRRLEETAQKQLTIWPFHVLIGSIGNALDPELFAAVLWHSLARQTQPTWLRKGSLPLTEHYSVLQPEVPLPDDPEAGRMHELLESLHEADHVIIAGEAESHCVLETLEDLVEEKKRGPDELRKIYVLRDCTSPVVHPEVDFHALALEQFAKFEAQGVNFINSKEGLPF